MNRISHHIISLSLFGVCLSISAQKKDSSIGSEVVNVIGTYTPTISDAFKIKETPSFEDDTINEKQEISYSITSFPVASTFTPTKGSAEAVEKRKKDKYFANYASLGVGNYGTVLGELYLTHALSSDQFLGAMLKHHSSQGGIKEAVLDDFFFDTGLDLSYATQKQGYSWRADIGYQNQIYNWYGLPIKYINFSPTQIQEINPKQSYNGLYVGGDLQMNHHVFKGGQLYYKRFWDGVSGAENRFWTKPSFDIDVIETRVKLNAFIDYVGTDFDSSYNQSVPELKSSFFNLGANPSISYQKDELALKAGVGLVYSMGKIIGETRNKFLFYPQIQLSYKVVGELMIAYGGIEGELKQNSYAELVGENPFIAPSQIIAPTDKNFDFYIGLKGKLADKTAYNLRGSYKNEKSKPFFTTIYTETPTQQDGFAFGNSFGINYLDLRTISIFADLKTEVYDQVHLNLGGTFETFTPEENQEAWYMPNIRLTAGLDADINEKLNLNAHIFYVGERKAFFGASFIDPLSNPISQTITLDGYIDLNIGANYRYNERLGLFLNMQNLADQKLTKWLNYPVQGIQILAGANYKFDF